MHIYVFSSKSSVIDDIVYREYAAQVAQMASVALTLFGCSGGA